MPIYEFQCECGHRFERLCKMNDSPVTSCPECGGEGRRVISVFSTGSSSSERPTSNPFPSGGSCNSCCSYGCPSRN